VFPDELFVDLFAAVGRRSVPPSVVATVMVLQRLEGLSDREAVDRFTFDARWRYAAGVGGWDGAGRAGFAHTVLADGVVYSRSGLTYQAGLLEEAGLITRSASPEDDRATLVAITGKGRALVGRVLPGHVEVVRRLLFDPLSGDDLHNLGDIMTRVRHHVRAQPPRSAAPRKRRPNPVSRAATQD
jgi:DNA-binding MarR family transcriptional regulator